MNKASTPPLSIQTLAAQAPTLMDSPSNELVGPLHLSTTYARDERNSYPSDYVYGRSDNATLRQTEAAIAALEGGSFAMLFGSGMAAAMSVVLAFDAPVHVIASTEMYYGLRGWLGGIGRHGHSIEFVDTTDLAAVAAAIARHPPTLVWIETPSNPMGKITDIAAVAGLAHARGAPWRTTVCVDSTTATPILTQPLAHGADVVMHSATKYLNGHSDVSAGVLVVGGQSELWHRIKARRAEQGAALGAFEAWLLGRGLRTLDVRIRTQTRTANWLAHALRNHPAVDEVLYPGLVSHPGHATATRQMSGGFGGLLSLRIRGGREAAVEVLAHTRLWKRATSFGGIESLIEHRASMEGEGSSCPDDLLRLSVGLEGPEDLYRDLDRGLRASLRSAARLPDREVAP